MNAQEIAEARAMCDGCSALSDPPVDCCLVHLTMLDALAAVTEERDLAIAHDRQPYPTADAYEKVCAALEKRTQDLTAVTAERDGLRGALADFADHGIRADTNPTMKFDDMFSVAGRYNEYLRRIDKSVRERAKAALAALQPAAVDDERKG